MLVCPLEGCVDVWPCDVDRPSVFLVVPHCRDERSVAVSVNRLLAYVIPREVVVAASTPIAESPI